MNVEVLQQRIDELTDDWSLSKYNFMKVSALKRMLEQSNLNTPECKECKQYVAIFAGMIEELPNLDKNEKRQPFEKQFNAMRSHFHKKHAFVAPDYHVGIYTIIGIATGAAIALLSSLLLAGVVVIDLVLWGLGLGIFAGYFLGMIQDRKFRRNDKVI